jgi:hypothetical protein
MAIRDRDRKILWSRAGNRCSVCRAVLVREGEVGGGLTVIGEECHIVSAADTGPRSGGPVADVDGYDNLILLCPNDHRLVDSLVDDYPVDRLEAIKRAHEEWVRAALEQSDGLAQLSIVRAQPSALRRLSSAKDVLNIAAAAHESSLDYEEIRSEEERDVVAGFLQSVHDLAEVWAELEPAARIHATFDLDRDIQSLEEQGWLVFGERTRGRIRGGVSNEDSVWDTAYLHLVHQDSPTIIRLELTQEPGSPPGQNS